MSYHEFYGPTGPPAGNQLDVAIHPYVRIEAIIPIEIEMPTLRTGIPEKANAEAITKELDMADELHEASIVRIASYKQRLVNLYNRLVKLRTFQDRDLVLRRVFKNTANPVDGKFQPNWEGLYMVVLVGAVRSFTLNKLDRTPIPIMWNATHLKRYY